MPGVCTLQEVLWKPPISIRHEPCSYAIYTQSKEENLVLAKSSLHETIDLKEKSIDCTTKPCQGSTDARVAISCLPWSLNIVPNGSTFEKENTGTSTVVWLVKWTPSVPASLMGNGLSPRCSTSSPAVC